MFRKIDTGSVSIVKEIPSVTDYMASGVGGRDN